MIRAFLICALAAWVCLDHRCAVLAIIFGIYAIVLLLNLLSKLHKHLTRKL